MGLPAQKSRNMSCYGQVPEMALRGVTLNQLRVISAKLEELGACTCSFDAPSLGLLCVMYCYCCLNRGSLCQCILRLGADRSLRVQSHQALVVGLAQQRKQHFPTLTTPSSCGRQFASALFINTSRNMNKYYSRLNRNHMCTHMYKCPCT